MADNVRSIAKAIVARSAQAPDAAGPRDTLTALDRSIVGKARVQLRIPLEDPVETRRHLEVVQEAVNRALVMLSDPRNTDRVALLTVRALMKAADDAINGR